MTAAPAGRDDAAIDAVIFDLDGVLADTEPIHFEVCRQVIAPATLPYEDYARFIGGGTENYGDWIERTFGVPKVTFYERYDSTLVERLRTGPPPLMAGADALVRAILRREVPVAVASMSKRAWVEPTLDAIGMRDLFPLVVTHDEVSQPKPDPEIYLQAASLLGVPPEACLAVEDSEHGVASAAAAGMWVVQLRQAAIASDPQPGAHIVIESFRDFDLGWLEGDWPGVRRAQR
ncbi:MAG: HAD family phosphatase [Chloroflexi bacterium]|nr:HAD family phosphatase [Chloroflexota bacterium]